MDRLIIFSFLIRLSGLFLMEFENKDLDFIRYYMGRHKVLLIFTEGKKAFILHLEKGKVGNKRLGYKNVDFPNSDITLLRFCWRVKHG